MNRVLTALIILATTATQSFAADKPNVVLMVMDNLGWGGVGAFGGGVLRGAETPRIAPYSVWEMPK